MMTNRDKYHWVVLRQGVDQELVQNTSMHGQNGQEDCDVVQRNVTTLVKRIVTNEQN